jgi:hypothetical protein
MTKHKGKRNDQRQSPRLEDGGGTTVSGKWVILAVVALALFGAGFSWWHRYTSTRMAARFWGPQHSSLIRNPANVQLITVRPMSDTESHNHEPTSQFPDHYHTLAGVVRVTERRDITQAHGLSHLRNELLMDRSFQPDELGAATADVWRSGLEFRDGADGAPLVLLFSKDGRRMLRHPPTVGTSLANTSTRFAEGWQIVLAEWKAETR